MSRPRRVTNEMIYEAAHKLIMQYGPNSLTFQKLGEVTGLVPAALVRRFKNKRQLFIEVDKYCLEISADTLADASKRNESPLEAIINGLSSDMSFATSADIYINGLAFLLKGLDDSELYANYQAAFVQQQKTIESLLQKAKLKKEIAQSVDTTELAKLLQVAQQGASHMWIMSQAEPIEQCVERYVRMVLRSYTTLSLPHSVLRK